MGGVEGIERAGHGDNRRFVVGGRSGIDARLRIEARAGLGQRDDLAVPIERTVAQHRLPWRRGPFLGIERLAVVMGIEDDGAPGVGSADLAVHGRRRAGDFQQSRSSRRAFRES